MQVRLDTAQWDRALAQLGKGNATKAAIRALKRTGSNAKTAMVRVVAQDTLLKQKVVRDRIFVSNVTGAPPKVTLSADATPIPLINFGARGSKRGGITARIGSPGAGKYPNAFIARVKGKNKDGSSGNHLGVFERDTVIRSRRGKPRSSPALGIHQLYGPSIWKAFESNIKVGIDRASEMLFKNMEHEIQNLVRQAKQ